MESTEDKGGPKTEELYRRFDSKDEGAEDSEGTDWGRD